MSGGTPVSADGEPVPLSDVAEDAVALIAAFRAAGGVSFDRLPLPELRRGYRAGCEANGLPPEPVGAVATHAVPVEGGEAALRLYRPLGGAGDDVLPLVAFIHGGGWVMGDLDTHDGLCRFLCNATGAAVAAIDYRLAPERRFPVPLEDCRAALAWITGRAEALGVDPGRTVLAGDSAGGNLATVLANDPAGLLPGMRVAAQALFYPVTDLSREAPSYARIAAGFPLTAGAMRWFRGGYLPPGADAADPRLSPLLTAARVQPPLFVVTVGHDPLCDEGIAYAAAAARGGTPVEHHHLPRHAHGLFTSAGRIATAPRLLHRAAAFIRDALALPGRAEPDAASHREHATR